MKAEIVVDSISLITPTTGIGRYSQEIITRINKNSDFDLTFFYGYKYSKKIIGKKNNTSYINHLIKNQTIKSILRSAISVTSKFNRYKYDIYWQPNYIFNKSVKAKYKVCSVHDFSFELYEKFHPKERIKYYKKNFYKSTKSSDLIITGSEYTKKEILDRFDIPEKNIKVIYHGIRHDIFKVYSNLNINIKLPKKFILSVGSVEPRKNLLGLLQAYNLLDEKIKAEYKLVLVGFKGWNNSEIMSLIEQNKENVLYLGFVSDEDLAKIYNLASCFVYPSFYEGFGLPPIESMACGTPVITSNIASIPEVCLDAALYCNPHDVKDISDKIVSVLEDENLANSLIEKGLSRSKFFDWDKSAKKHEEVFKELT